MVGKLGLLDLGLVQRGGRAGIAYGCPGDLGKDDAISVSPRRRRGGRRPAGGPAPLHARQPPRRPRGPRPGRPLGVDAVADRTKAATVVRRPPAPTCSDSVDAATRLSRDAVYALLEAAFSARRLRPHRRRRGGGDAPRTPCTRGGRELLAMEADEAMLATLGRLTILASSASPTSHAVRDVAALVALIVAPDGCSAPGRLRARLASHRRRHRGRRGCTRPPPRSLLRHHGRRSAAPTPSSIASAASELGPTRHRPGTRRGRRVEPRRLRGGDVLVDDAPAR